MTSISGAGGSIFKEVSWDDPDTREMIAHALQQSGANVIQAGIAPEMLRQFQQARPHLPLTDVGMPDMDGYQLLQAAVDRSRADCLRHSLGSRERCGPDFRHV